MEIHASTEDSYVYITQYPYHSLTLLCFMNISYILIYLLLEARFYSFIQLHSSSSFFIQKDKINKNEINDNWKICTTYIRPLFYYVLIWSPYDKLARKGTNGMQQGL